MKVLTQAGDHLAQVVLRVLSKWSSGLPIPPTGHDFHDLHTAVGVWKGLRGVAETRQRVKLINRPEGDRERVLGPFDWVTLTYDSLRAGQKDQDAEVEVSFSSGFWWLVGEAGFWTDIDIDVWRDS